MSWFPCLGGPLAADVVTKADIDALTKRLENSLLKQQREAQKTFTEAMVQSVGQTMMQVDQDVKAAIGGVEKCVADSAVAHSAALSLELQRTNAEQLEKCVEKLSNFHEQERAASDNVLSSLSTALNAATATRPPQQFMRRQRE